MYLPLGVNILKAWDVPRVLPDRRVASSASEVARKIKRDIAKRHLKTLCQYEEDLLRRVDRDLVDIIYNQLGLPMPMPMPMPMPQPKSVKAKDESTHDTGTVRDRDADYEAIQLARSRFHPAQTVREQAAENLALLDKQEIERWMKDVENWGAITAECGITRTEEAPMGGGMDNNSDAKADADFEWPDDDGHQAQWEEGDESDPLGDGAEDHRDDSSEGYRAADDDVSECAACDFSSGLPTPPPSEASTRSLSPFSCKYELTPDTECSSTTEELTVLLNDRKVLTAYLAGIEEGIKKARKSRAEKDADREKALQLYNRPMQRPRRARGQDGQGGWEQSQEPSEEEKPLRWFDYEKMHVYDESSGKWELTMERRGRCYRLERASRTETLDRIEQELEKAGVENQGVGNQGWSTGTVPDWAGATGSGWYA